MGGGAAVGGEFFGEAAQDLGHAGGGLSAAGGAAGAGDLSAGAAAGAEPTRARERDARGECHARSL